MLSYGYFEPAALLCRLSVHGCHRASFWAEPAQRRRFTLMTPGRAVLLDDSVFSLDALRADMGGGA